MDTCTRLCRDLASITLNDGHLPSHDDLVSQLNLNQEGKEEGHSLGTWGEIITRRGCPFCALVAEAVRSDHLAEIDPGQAINVLLFPDETSFRLSYPSPLGTRLSFTTENADHVVAPDSARHIASSDVPPSQILDWLKKCDDGHEGCYLKPTEAFASEAPRMYFEERLTSNFRVLDVADGCLRRKALDIPYVSLSYVWGQLPMFHLESSNIDQLSTPGALDDIHSLLPKTITDAIGLVKSLGLRYLWVDALCLIQDAASDVAIGIELMNSIYSGSYFTIIASLGADASAGLPGISPISPRPGPQIATQLRPGLRMTVWHSISRQLDRSIYSKRGWTLQELVLSRRAVIFTDSQVHFRCQGANWSEGSWSDRWLRWLDTDDSNISRIPEPWEDWAPSLWAYQKLCEDYSRRSLRYGGDALRAVAGMCRPLLAGMRTPAVEGLPAYYVDHFLLFVSLDGESERRPQFGSFSWAGWQGKVMWPRENYVRFEDGRALTDQENILGFFQRNRLCEWDVIDLEANVESISTLEYGKPSPLRELMAQFPDTFTRDDLGNTDSEADDLFARGGGHGDRPDWETRTLDSVKPADGGFHQKALDMINGREEFERMLERRSNHLGRLELQNWWASRNYRLHKGMKDKPNAEVVSMAWPWEKSQYRFRGSAPGSVFGNDGPDDLEDNRAEEARMSAPRVMPGSLGVEAPSVSPGATEGWTDDISWARLSDSGLSTTGSGQGEYERQEGTSGGGDSAGDGMSGGSRSGRRREGRKVGSSPAIPKFPPYAVLRTRTLSLFLSLGRQVSTSKRKPASAPRTYFDRVPGFPLQSESGRLVGSLHPDSRHLLGEPGSAVELLVLSRSQTHMVGSALSKPDSEAGRARSSDMGPQDLLWVMYIDWNKGVAERRGVGQISTAALRESVGSRPELKTVFLG